MTYYFKCSSRPGIGVQYFIINYYSIAYLTISFCHHYGGLRLSYCWQLHVISYISKLRTYQEVRMIDRRDLIKKLVCGGIVLGYTDLQAFIDEAGALMNVPEKIKNNWNRTILCMVDNPDLEAVLQACAEKMHCEILFDWPHSPELLLEHYFVAVVDGRIVDEGVWDMYVEFCNDGDIKAPCLMIGNANRLSMPKTGNVFHFDLDDNGTIKNIINTIKARLAI